MRDLPNTARDRASLRRQYEVECELADQLRAAPPSERAALYRAVYNELFRRVPDHPQLVRRRDAAMQRESTERQLRFLQPWLRPDAVYLEVGAGDCHLAMAVARQVQYVYAVDVSREISGEGERPENFSLILSDGVGIDVPEGVADVAYSHQLVEHLHTEDAERHFREVFAALAPGGHYVCTTPHRFSGPHDISRHFDTEAKGFHLKEYIYGELSDLFRRAGFSSTSALGAIRGRCFGMADAVVRGAESALRAIPAGPRRRLARAFPFRSVFDSVTIVGRKSPRAAVTVPAGGRPAS
jgi:SAM-dependent methyltransferase